MIMIVSLLQITDFVLPDDSAAHISLPLTQSADLPNITSTPIHQPCEPSASFGQQEKDNDSQRQAPVIPIVPNPSPPTTVIQPKYIQPWLGYVPRKPSHKLFRSNIFKSCNIDDKSHQDAGMVVARKRPGPSTVTLKKNSPKHSSVAEENSDLSCKLTFFGDSTFMLLSSCQLYRNSMVFFFVLFFSV